MCNAAVLMAALQVVEQRLQEPMSADDLAKACYSSCSGLQKLFRYAFQCSVSEYITKRRLSCASKALLQTDRRILDIALDYQYGSNEAFSRAFKRFWGISPSAFRRTRRFAQLYPPLELRINAGGIRMQMRKPVDISELYDVLKGLGGTYVLGADIRNFDAVNRDYGYAAGDLVIAGAFARLEQALAPDMMLFRVGGDEFAIVTGSAVRADAEALAQRIALLDGQCVPTEAGDIPLTLWQGISQVPEESLSYERALALVSQSIAQAKEAETAQKNG